MIPSFVEATGSHRSMCRTILDITPLILFAIWLFGALPLIYLYGGPDEMIKELPSWAIWAPVLAAVAAAGSATVAYLALRVNRQNQRETTAKTNFREFLKLCVEYPDLARGTPTEENGAKYEWFVAHFLWATEEILKYEPEPGEKISNCTWSTMGNTLKTTKTSAQKISRHTPKSSRTFLSR
jgi:hypothetical protein